MLMILAATICFQFGQTEDAYTYISEGLLEEWYSLSHIAPKDYFEAFQYVFSAWIVDDVATVI